MQQSSIGAPESVGHTRRQTHTNYFETNEFFTSCLNDGCPALLIWESYFIFKGKTPLFIIWGLGIFYLPLISVAI